MRAWFRLGLSVGWLLWVATSLAFGQPAQGTPARPAQPNKLEAAVSLGSGKAVKVAVVHEGDGVSLAVDGRRHALPLRDAARMEAASIELSKGRRAAVVTVTAENGARAGVLLARARAGAEVAFVGPLDPRGDSGERTWTVIETATDPAGEPRVIVSERHERTAVCGNEPAPIDARALDPVSGKLVSLPSVRPFSKRDVQEVAATTTSPGPEGPPALRALRTVSASSIRGIDPPWLASPFSALTDGDPKSAWSTAAERPAQHAFVTFSVNAAGREIRALSIVPRGVGAEAPPPRSFWLVADAGPALHVTLAEPVIEGQAQWIALPEGRAMSCVSLVVDATPASGPGQTGEISIAELAAYTDLDFGGGLERLIAELSAGGAQAARAVEVLRRIGPSAVAPLVAALPALAPAGRARAVRVFAAYLEHAGAREALQAALDDPDGHVRELAHEALAAGDAAARAVLSTRISSASPGAEAAASALAQTAPAEAMSALLAGLGAQGASERPQLREALGAACERLKGACVEAVRGWLRSEPAPKVAARAAVALALARERQLSGVPELVGELIESARAEASAFEDRWRLVSAAPHAAPSSELDGWLDELVAKEERWMLRAQALAALSERGSTLSAGSAKRALRDEYPRVRLVAVNALAVESSATADLARHAQRDRWPMVRAAAYEALAGHASAAATLEGGVSDPAKAVRASALRALTKARVASAWPAVEKVLRNDNEWPEVTIEAAAYARALCIQEAREPLVALLVRALEPNAAPFEAEVGGPVFEALAELGGQAAKEAQRIAARSTSPQGLKAMAKRAAARPAACAPEATASEPAM